MEKKIIKPRVKKIETSETKTEVAVEESEAKKQFRSYMETYKVKNPVKYAIKETELNNQLNQL
jgi:hypothetical protein